MAAITPTIPYQQTYGFCDMCWAWPCSCWMFRSTGTITVYSNTITTRNVPVANSIWPSTSAKAKAQEVWERTDRLKRAALPAPRAPRLKAPPPTVAWPVKMQRFRCRTKSTRPVQQVVGRGSR